MALITANKRTFRRFLDVVANLLDMTDSLTVTTIHASGSDDSPYVNDVLAIVAEGTILSFPDGDYQFESEVHLSTSRVILLLGPATTFRRIGATGGAVLRIGASEAATDSSGWCIDVSVFGGIIDTGGIADQGILIKSAERPTINGTRIIGPANSGETGLLITNFTGTNVYNRTRDFVLERLDITVTGAAEGIHMGGDTSTQEGGIYKGTLYDCFVSHVSGTGYSIAQVDDIRFYNCDALPSGPAYSMDFRGGANAWNAATFCQIFSGYPLRTANGLLAEALDASETDVTIASATPFPTSGEWVLIAEEEEMLVTAGQGTTTLTVTRGVNGSSAGSHSDAGSIRRLGSGVVVRGTGLAFPAHDIIFHGVSKIDSGNQIELEPGGRAYFTDSRGRHTLVPDERSFASWTEDFVGTSVTSGSIGTHGWQTHGTTPFSYVAPEADHPGIGRISTDGAASTPFGISLNTLGLLLPEEEWEMIWKVRLNSDVATTTARFGLAIASGAGTDDPGGIYFEKLSSAGNWRAVTSTTAGGGTETATNTARVAYEDYWYTLRIRLRSNGAIGFTIGSRWANNQDGHQITTTIPTVALMPFAQIISTTGPARTADMDLMSLHILGMDRR